MRRGHTLVGARLTPVVPVLLLVLAALVRVVAGLCACFERTSANVRYCASASDCGLGAVCGTGESACAASTGANASASVLLFSVAAANAPADEYGTLEYRRGDGDEALEAMLSLVLADATRLRLRIAVSSCQGTCTLALAPHGNCTLALAESTWALPPAGVLRVLVRGHVTCAALTAGDVSVVALLVGTGALLALLLAAGARQRRADAAVAEQRVDVGLVEEVHFERCASVASVEETQFERRANVASTENAPLERRGARQRTRVRGNAPVERVRELPAAVSPPTTPAPSTPPEAPAPPPPLPACPAPRHVPAGARHAAPIYDRIELVVEYEELPPDAASFNEHAPAAHDT